MTNTTETFWELNGVSLQTFAFNIETLGGDRESVPPVRGDDIQVPYRPGTRWVPKVEDAKTVSLGMWVLGADEDGNVPTHGAGLATFQSNWRALRRLLWGNPKQQSVLTKRFWVDVQDLDDAGIDHSAMTKTGMGAYALYTASANVSYVGGLTPRMTGGTRATFTVDFRLSDPYFYGPEVMIEFSMETGGGNPGPEQDVFILGDGQTTKIEWDLEGPLTSAMLTNESVTGELWMRYANVVDDGETATVRVDSFSATHYPTGDPFKASGYVQHDGDRFWMYLVPGENTLVLDAPEGTGTAVVRYLPGWF